MTNRALKLTRPAADPSATDANQYARADRQKSYDLPESIQNRDLLTRSAPNQDWMASARCLDSESLPWFKTQGNPTAAPPKIAVRCEPCPVRQDCILDALRMPRYGVVGWRAGYRSTELEHLRAEAATRGIHVHAERQANGKALTPSEVDEYIRDRRDDGAALVNIARELNEGGFAPPPRAEHWTQKTVRNALKRMTLAPSEPNASDLAAAAFEASRAAGAAKDALSDAEGLLESLGIDPDGLAEYLEMDEPSDDELAELDAELDEVDE